MAEKKRKEELITTRDVNLKSTSERLKEKEKNSIEPDKRSKLTITTSNCGYKQKTMESNILTASKTAGGKLQPNTQLKQNSEKQKNKTKTKIKKDL